MCKNNSCGNKCQLSGKSCSKTKPLPPLDRVIKEGYGNFCRFCGSTTSRKGLLSWFGIGKRVCHNKECFKRNGEL